MIVDLFFLTDFILKFFTGFYQYGRLIKKKRVAAKLTIENSKALLQKQVCFHDRHGYIYSNKLLGTQWTEQLSKLPTYKHLPGQQETATLHQSHKVSSLLNKDDSLS
jgi:hypothetical protein